MSDKRILFIVLLCVLCASNLHAQHLKGGLNVEAGPTIDINNFRWSIAGNIDGESPNILSELKFNQIASLGYYLQSGYTPITHLTLLAYFQRDRVFNGHGSDTDYKDDNRTNPSFKEPFESDQGHLMILKGGIGSRIYLSKKIVIMPSLLYYLGKQKFYLSSHQTQHLRSTYFTTVQGVELSIKNTIYLNKIIFFSLALSYQRIDYQAKANWNLRDIFRHPLSFLDEAKGYAFDSNVLLGVNINKRISISVGGRANITTIGEGTDTAYLKNGNKMATQFNGAKNLLRALTAGIHISI